MEHEGNGVTMRTRDKLGALIGAGLLTVALGSTVFAVTPLAAPTYTVLVDKTATPDVVGAGGGDVLFTVTVQNTGTGSFAIVNVTDSLAGCTLSAPTGIGAPNTLASGDTWTFTCTVTGVTPDTTNTATVYACHNNGGCTNGSHDATGTASVTVTLDTEATLPPPTASPEITAAPTASPEITAAPTGAPTASPAGGGGGATDQPTMAPTNSALDGGSGPADGAWLMVVVLGVLLASVVILTPARAKRRS
jgi:hypothetical protein